MVSGEEIAALEKSPCRAMTVCLVINRRSGRLGNNLYQLLNSLTFAEETGGSVEIAVKLPAFLRSLPKRFTFNQNGKKEKRIAGRFFYPHSLPKQVPCDAIHRMRAGRHLHDAFLAGLGPLEPLGDDTIVVHIRSGDNFTKPCSIDYIQPPLSFYKRVCAGFAKIIVLTEKDKRNPCIAGMLAWRPDGLLVPAKRH